MPASFPHPRKTLGTTFLVAMSVLALGALLQMGAVGWAFVARYRSLALQARAPMLVPPPAPRTEEALSTEALEPLASADALADAAPLPEAADPAPGGEPQPIVPPAKPEPVPIAKLAIKAPPNTRFQELIEQGRILRERGDMSNALTKLREAQALDPSGPQAMSELALTYEKMGLLDKAAEQWKRVHDLGDAAGSYFSAAETRLRQSQSAAMQNTEGGVLENSGARTPQWTLCLGEVASEPLTDPAALRKFLLKVPLKLRAEGHVDVKDVAIHVLFYEQLNGKELVRTSANVSSRWASPPPDWADSDVEVLEVEYSQPRPDPNLTVREDRKYFGYIVRLYYKSELQDSRADPQRLGTQFAAPATLEKSPIK